MEGWRGEVHEKERVRGGVGRGGGKEREGVGQKEWEGEGRRWEVERRRGGRRNGRGREEVGRRCPRRRGR